jgi:exonuclease VII small subunit
MLQRGPLERYRTGISSDGDRDDLDLEDQLLLYREGCTLAAQAKRILDTARAEVEFLMGEHDESGDDVTESRAT